MNHPATPHNQATAAMMQQQQHQAQGNLPGPQTPQQQQQQMMQGGSPAFGFPGAGGQQAMGMQGSPPPMSMPGSPYRGAKRKMDSPHMGGATPAINPMGPPSMMPNRMSMPGSSGSSDLAAGVGMNGIPGPQNAGHQQGSSQSPRPRSSNDMMNMNFGPTATATTMGGGGVPPPGPSPQTPVRQGSMMGGGTPGSGAGQVGMGSTPMAQALAHQQQQQARQPSLPPGASPLQKEPAMGMGMGGGMRASVPPAIPGPSVTGPVARTPSTVAGTPVPGPSGSTVPAAAVSGGNALPASNATASSSTMAGQLPPLPASVQLNPATTQVTPVPLIDSLKHIPEISEGEISEIQGWMKKDKEYEGVLRKMKERMAGEVRGMFGGAMWWEKGAPDVDVNRWKRGREMFDVRYPLRRGKEKEGRERRKRQREGLRLCVHSFPGFCRPID